MSIILSHKCEKCGGDIEMVNDYARCKACWHPDKTYDKAKLLMEKKGFKK